VHAKQAVEAVKAQIATNTIKSRLITETLISLTDLIDRYQDETIQELDDEVVCYE
jgi:hypothetical protein